MNTNTAAGTAKKVEGKIQETGGHIRTKVDNALGDTKGATEGLKDQAAGLAKQAQGEAQNTVGKIQDATKKAFNNEE